METMRTVRQEQGWGISFVTHIYAFLITEDLIECKSSVTGTQTEFGLVKLGTKQNQPRGLRRGERSAWPSGPFPEAGAGSSEGLFGTPLD